jgi:hypothetical protein
MPRPTLPTPDTIETGVTSPALSTSGNFVAAKDVTNLECPERAELAGEAAGMDRLATPLSATR